MFNYNFMKYALIVGLIISLCSSLLGVSLTLRKKSMIGDGLSHVAFGAIALGTALNFLSLKLTLLIVSLASFFLLKVGKSSNKGDSDIAILSSSSLAFGIMAISLKGGVNSDLNNYLFGSILSLNKEDLILSLALGFIVIFFFIFFYHKIFALTFDDMFSQSTGLKVNFYEAIIAILTSITIVLGMNLMGTLLISSLLIFPSIGAKEVAKTFKSLTIISALFSITAFTVGLFLSYYLNLPTGSTIVLTNLSFLLILKLIGIIKRSKLK